MLAALRALEGEPGFDFSKSPVILIDDTTSLGIEYLARYWILPWAPISPTTAKDKVFDSLLKHLHTAGIALAYPRTDVYTSRMPARQFDSHSNRDLRALLENMEIFRPLDSVDLEDVVKAMERQKLAEGQVLFRQDDTGDSLFVLIEGLLDVRVNTDGQEKRIARILPGECLGEMSLLTGEKRSATISAATESVVYKIGKQPISFIMERRPALLESLSEILARRRVTHGLEGAAGENVLISEEMEGFTRQFIIRMRKFLGLRSPELTG